MQIIKEGILSKPNGDYIYNAWPSVITLADGSLISAWSGERLGHVCPFGKVMVSKSFDGGLTWSTPYCALNTPLDDRDAGLTELDGKIYLTSFNNSRQMQIHRNSLATYPLLHNRLLKRVEEITDEEELKYLGANLSISSDGGRTFEYLGTMPITAPHGVIKKKDGSLLMIGRRFYDEAAANFEYLPEGIYAMEISKDGKMGKPYLIVEPNDEGLLYCEPHAIDLGDKILLGIRAQNDKGVFTIYTALSFDGGKTFSKPQPTGLEGSPPHFFALDSGEVLLSYARRKEDFPECVALSVDGGVTFSEKYKLTLGKNWDIGYPATTLTREGNFVTVYYQSPDIKYIVWRI